MAQKQRTVNELITAAFFLIGEFDENDPIPGDDFSRALDILNLLLDHYSGQSIRVPFVKTIKFKLTTGKQDYVITNVPGVPADIVDNRLADIEYCNLKFEDIFWPVTQITRTQLFDNYFNNSVSFRPEYILLDNQEVQTTISFYPKPNQDYDIELRGKFYLDKFDLGTPIVNIPLSWHRFIIYGLGRELIAYYPSGNWGATQEENFMTMYENIISNNDTDMTVRPTDLIRRRARTYNGSLINILGDNGK